MHLYSQIEEHLLKQIKTGELKEGDAIPTEVELSEQFGVSRPTVRQALNKLVNNGYLERTKGKGSFVKKPKLTQEYTRFIESYNVEIAKKGLIPKTIVLEKSIIESDAEIAKRLGIVCGEKVICITRLRYAFKEKGGQPIVLTTVYIPYMRIPKLLKYDFETFSLYEILENNNLYVKRVQRELEITIANDQFAKLLEINEGDAVHLISSVGYLEDGNVIEYSVSYYPAERNKFIVEIIR
ncbi:MAG: GntR family transcriptional regulator [Cellulosilyticaceae bacterium]